MQVNVKVKNNKFLDFDCQGNSVSQSCSLLNQVLNLILPQPGWFTTLRALLFSGRRNAVRCNMLFDGRQRGVIS
jgi:hypothetical protein